MSLKSLISTQSLRLKRVNVSNATYYSPYGINATMLIVSGGGGAGGWSINTYNGGGGGGGGLVYNSNIPIYNLYNYTVVVGAGGAGGSTAGANGSNSSIIGGGYLGSLSFTTALGGGGGGGGTFTSSGYNGGSGGGGGGIVSATAGGTSLQNSIIGYGFGNLGAGGIGNYSSGGGGGAGASGSLYNAGNGLAYNFANGSSVYYAGGGAGVNGSGNTAGTAGLGGGGVSTALSTSLNGANNTGGGGGGSNNTVSGGSGGSGIVIVSYPLPQYFTGGIVTNLTSNVVHTFNTSASLNGLLTPIDTYQPYNSLILHAEGTNGSNNSVFLDSSSNTYIPFNGTYSNYFNNSLLSIPASSNFLFGTNNFTIECWVYPTSNAAIAGIMASHQSGGEFQFLLNANGGIQFDLNTNGGATSDYSSLITSSSSSKAPVRQWTHLAAIRNGNIFNVYVNGVADATTINTTGTNVGSYGGNKPIYVGSWGNQTSIFPGFISNVRINNGTAVYTGNFTPQTTPLTITQTGLGNVASITTGTNLLTSQSSTIVDNAKAATITIVGSSANVSVSSGGVGITKTGNPGQGTFTPFLNSGWSNYFGSGNYLSIGAGTNTAMPGDFTMEGWIYGSANTIMGQGAATSAFSLGVTTTGYPFVSVDIQYGLVAEGQTLSLTAPTGMVFTSLLYAGYGEINGTAPNYGNNRVSGTSRSICETTFIGKSGTVSQAATNAIFGDPAGGTAKYLAVTATVGLMSTSVIDLTKWNHIAAVRSGSILTLYVNGVPVSSITYASTVGAASANVYVGTNYENTATILTTLGNLSNVRIVRGNALYTSGFTVPTTQLTAVANTILLTCSNTIIKASNSINSNVAVGVTGSLQVQSFAPFNPSNTYSTTLVGGSLYFNGSTDFLTIANNSNQEFGANNFTIEFFWYPQSTSRQWFYHATTDYWFGVDYASQGAVMGLWASSTGSSWNLINADAGGNGISTGAPKINQWNHVAVGRNGGTWSMWLNGARCLNLTGITSAIVDRSTQNKIVGAWAGGTQYFVNGYLSNFKIVNGTDIYGVTNSNITVPTSPLTATANTVLLLNGTNAGIIDNSSQKVNLTAYGTGVVSNTISKFGNTSLYFDGTSGYFGVTGSPSLFNFGTGDYTVEMWIYLTATANYQYLFDTNTAGDGSTATPFRLRVVPITGGYGLDMVNQGGSTISGLLSSTSYPMQLNTWNHVAVVTINGVTSFYHNGNLSNTPTTTGLSWYCTATNRPVIGISGSPASQNWFQGYMDDIRVTKGYARYSVNFTPPTSAFLDT